MASLVSSTAVASSKGIGNPRVGVGVIVTSEEEKGKILLGRRRGSHGAGKWALPGGALELDESFEECAIRELKEETNLSIDRLSLVHVQNNRRMDGDVNKHWITIAMHGHLRRDSSPLETMEPHKCEEWLWLSHPEIASIRNDSPNLLFEPFLALFDQGHVLRVCEKSE